MTTEPDQSPNWALSPELDIKCPQCDVLLSGVNWITVVQDDEAEARTVGMVLVPCAHELSMPPWKLTTDKGVFVLRQVTE